MRLLSLSSAAVLVLTACLSDSARPDPYAGMSCERKIAAIAREIQEYQASQAPAAKRSASRSDTAQPDTAQPDTARVPIQILRGWPPVAGVDPQSPDSGMVIPDRSDTGKVGPASGVDWGVQWIPPVGFDSPAATPGTLPVSENPAPEVTQPSTLPTSVSTLQIVSSGAYKARVRIHDSRDALVREFDQDFGYRGELDNLNRVVPGGLVSYLVWDGKDLSGREVPSGVYLWKVRLELESKTVVEKSSKTGYIGAECRQAP